MSQVEVDILLGLIAWGGLCVLIVLILFVANVYRDWAWRRCERRNTPAARIYTLEDYKQARGPERDRRSA
jgi:hypothetical protein